jgi:predicted nucleic acid-binding protein
MILVDTNVWSEGTRLVPDPNVRSWASENSQRLWLSSVVIGELLSGAAMLPEGKRKQHFLDQYELMIVENADRIAVFDLDAARRYAEVVAYLEKSGRNPNTADCQIAAIALSRGLSLATRNTKDFEGLRLTLINPWQP